MDAACCPFADSHRNERSQKVVTILKAARKITSLNPASLAEAEQNPTVLTKEWHLPESMSWESQPFGRCFAQQTLAKTYNVS